MRWLSAIKLRKEIVRELRHQISLEKLRMRACGRELVRLSMRDKAFQVMWSQKLDHYQQILLLEKQLEFIGVFWLLTGRRWLLRMWLLTFIGWVVK